MCRLLFGGGLSDLSEETPQHGHWDKHGQWHADVAQTLRKLTSRA